MKAFRPIYRCGLLVTALVGLLAGPLARAQSTLVSTQSFDLLGGDLPANVNFTPFNSALGTLQSVSLSFSGNQRYDFSFWNNNIGSTNPIHYGYQPDTAGSSTLTLAPTVLSIPDSAILSGAATLTGLTSAQINAARAAASSAFFAGNDPTAGVLSSGGFSVFGTLPFAGTLSLSNTFNGTLSAQFEPFTSSSLTTGNVASSEFQDFAGFASVTYTYVAIPEPATYTAILGVAMFGFATLRRRRTV